MKKNNLIKIIAFIFGVCLFSALLFVVVSLEPKRSLPQDTSRLQVVFMGDSNVAFEREGTDIPTIVSEITGAETYNCAIGGTTAIKLNRENYFDRHISLCCMDSLVNIMCTGNTEIVHDNKEMITIFSNSALDKVQLLAQLDYTKVDYLFLCYGVNDYTLGAPLDNPKDPYDTYTYCGTYRTAIDKLRKDYPNLTIVLASPSYYWTLNEDKEFVSGYEVDYGGGTIDQYRDALMEVANSYERVYVLDVLTNMQINENNYQEYMEDGMHVNAKGQQLWAENAAKLIMEAESE